VIFFFNNKAIDQIQEDYGYSTRHNAHNQKHKCVEQIRKIKEKEERSKIKILDLGDFLKLHGMKFQIGRF